MGSLLKAKDDLAAAEPLLREALGVKRETLGNRHPSTLASINNLGTLLLEKGDLTAAESLLREALEGMRETFGNRHPNTLICINNLGSLFQEKCDFDAAEADEDVVLPIAESELKTATAIDLSKLDITAAQARKIAPLLCANADLKTIRCEGGELSVSDLRDEDELEWDSEEYQVYAKGDLAAAEPLFREALEMWRKTLGNRHPNTLTSICNPARC